MIWSSRLFQRVKALKRLVRRLGRLRLVDQAQLLDYILYDYRDFAEYQDVQIATNRAKFEHIWADRSTMTEVENSIRKQVNKPIHGLCHGVRNGFEIDFFHESVNGYQCIGTDISETIKCHDFGVQHDFHERKEDWVNRFDFVYSNSLDQSWKPQEALKVWLEQIKISGILIIEHTEFHGPKGASRKDPFGVRPTVLPYLLSSWFGHQISVSFQVCRKSNMDVTAHLYSIRKLVDLPQLLPNQVDLKQRV